MGNYFYLDNAVRGDLRFVRLVGPVPPRSLLIWQPRELRFALAGHEALESHKTPWRAK
jgi:hypothetical protein